MKKTIHLIFYFSLFLFLHTTQAQILRGRVFQYLPSGDSIALAGVSIAVLGQPITTVSKTDGSYQLFLHGIVEGQNIQIKIEKKGWKILNDDVLKKTYRVESGVEYPSVYLCLETDFRVQKQPFDLAVFIQNSYQKRLSFWEHDRVVFQRTHSILDVKMKTIADKKEALVKQKQFLIAHTPEISKFLNAENQNISDFLIKNMYSFLKTGKITDADNLINKTQYQNLKQAYLDSPRDTHRLTELCLLAFLKAQCAMFQFNAPQADFYFNESLSLNEPQAALNVHFYDEYTQFLIAFDKPKEAFENMQLLLVKAKMANHTEGVAYAYTRLSDFYLNKKLYNLAQQAGQNALLQFDNLTIKQKNEQYLAQRVHVMRQLATIFTLQDTLPLAIKLGEKALILGVAHTNLAQKTDLRLFLAQTHQKIFERTGLVDNREKALAQLAILDKEFLIHPPVKTTLNKFNDLKSYIEDINKPRLLAQKRQIAELEIALKRCKTIPQTIFYRSQIIVLLQKLNNQLPKKSPLINLELAQYYEEQALAQIENRNFREVEANALKALTLNVSDDNLIALLATAQWLQNKKPTAQETFRLVKDNNMILKTINDFEKKGVTKSIFDPIRLDWGQRKAKL